MFFIYQMKNNQGFLSIFTLIFISILMLGILGLSSTSIIHYQTNHLYYLHQQSLYLAESGFAFAQKKFSLIPTLSVPDKNIKTWIYDHLDQSLALNLGHQDLEIFLLKTTSQELYTIGICQKKYKTILRQNFTLLNDHPIFSNWTEVNE